MHFLQSVQCQYLLTVGYVDTGEDSLRTSYRHTQHNRGCSRARDLSRYSALPALIKYVAFGLKERTKPFYFEGSSSAFIGLLHVWS